MMAPNGPNARETVAQLAGSAAVLRKEAIGAVEKLRRDKRMSMSRGREKKEGRNSGKMGR